MISAEHELPGVRNFGVNIPSGLINFADWDDDKSALMSQTLMMMMMMIILRSTGIFMLNTTTIELDEIISACFKQY